MLGCLGAEALYTTGKIVPINLANSLTDVDSFSLAFLQAAGLAPVGTSSC